MVNVLLLFIYSRNGDSTSGTSFYYEEMLNLQRMYVHRHPNVDSFFVTYREEQEDVTVIEGDMIYVKGREGILNILKKTLVAFEHLMKLKQYDYVVRTNISTLFKLNEMYEIIEKQVHRNEVYVGGCNYKLIDYIDNDAGINQRNIKFYDIRNCWFIQGTCIIFSKDVVEYMIQNQEKFIYDVVDDISIALFLRSFMNHVYTKSKGILNVNQNSFEPGPVVRNKTSSREKDIENMKAFVEQILKKGYDV